MKAHRSFWLILTVVVGLAALMPASAVAVPIADFILYGENGVQIGSGSIINGLVGARTNDPVAGAAIKLNGGGTTVNGDARSGGDVNLQNNAHITGTLFRAIGTSLTLGAGATVGADSVVADPGLPTLPAPAVFGCPTGGANFIVPANNQSLTVAPGNHGTIQTGANFTLTFNGAGNYFFDSITAASGAKIVVNAAGPVHVFVCGKVNFSGSVGVDPDTLLNTDFTVEVHGAGDDAFRAGGGSDWIGDVYAPFGEIHFGGGGCCSFFFGRFWGDRIDIEHAVRGGGTTTCCEELSPPAKDSTLRHDQKNANNGANLSLRVGPQIAALIGFDVSAVNFAKVTNAILVLTVCHTPGDPTFCPDPPIDWPLTGGPVSAHRLNPGFEHWVEGNGNNFPIPNNPRGTGSGVTWNCVVDTNISNFVRNCTGTDFWSTGGQAVDGPPRGPVLHFNTMVNGDQVTFDVTLDVQAGLGVDSTFMSWFIRRTGTGSISYYSREGATFLGDGSLAPQLIITVSP
jgi:hypothetical protein